MREKFELACKIIGLLFFITGIFMLLSAIVFFLFYNTLDTISPGSRAMMSQSQIAELQEVSNSIRNYYAGVLLFGGIMEMLLGYYLMKSGNLFLKLCYPLKNRNVPVKPVPEIQLDIQSKESQPEPKEPSADKYAPPGYFEK